MSAPSSARALAALAIAAAVGCLDAAVDRYMIEPNRVAAYHGTATLLMVRAPWTRRRRVQLSTRLPSLPMVDASKGLDSLPAPTAPLQ
jgi:hypothetical protein